jgi:hypothetical protein
MLDSMLLAVVEVCGSQVPIGLLSLEEVIRDDQHRMAPRDECTLLAPPGGKAPILGR